MAQAYIDLGWVDLLGRLRTIRTAESVARSVPPTIAEADAVRGFGEVESLAPGSITLIPDWGTLRHVPGTDVPLVLSSLYEDGHPSPRCSRSFLREVAGAVAADGLEVSAAVELEFFLVNPATRMPIYDWIDNYNLSQRQADGVLEAIRTRLHAARVTIEASNPEYSGGQFEVNISRSSALDAADHGVLLRHYAGMFACEFGFGATFLAKPWTDQSGSGMHVHQSLWRDGQNVFYGGPDELSETGRAYLAGLLGSLQDFALLCSPTPNGYHRRADGSFAPTKVSWASDNRTTAVRTVVDGASSTRIEHRDSGADANIHLSLGAQILAGIDGMRRGLQPPPAVIGSAYAQDLPQLPRTFLEAFERLEVSELAARLLPPELLDAYLLALRPEIEVLICSSADWERARYADIHLG